MERASVIKSLMNVAKTAVPENGKVFLYGSRARGDSHGDSDWDVLIILDKNKIEQSDYDDVVFPFTMLGWELGEMIVPVIYTKREWETCSFLPFCKNVEQDKIVLV